MYGLFCATCGHHKLIRAPTSIPISESYIEDVFRQRPESSGRCCRAPYYSTKRSVYLTTRRKLADHQRSACAFAASNDALIGNMPRFCCSHQSRGHWAAFPENIERQGGFGTCRSISGSHLMIPHNRRLRPAI
jgi:hypothetical protein